MQRFTLMLILTLPLAAGCSTFLGSGNTTRTGQSSSLVDYLYPNGEIPAEPDATLPVLDLPLRVGIAFVPSRGPSGYPGRSGFSASEKELLLERVAEAFRDREYVSSIETIPEQYLKSARGVVGMQQVAAMHGIDVMALVSYDQLTFASERDSALLYWTVVGTALIKGNSNEVHTLIDTAVFDVESGKLLFRAPGVHSDQRNSTLFDRARDQRELQSESIAAANADMITNLDAELGSFEDRVRQGEEVAAVNWTNGGGGSTGIIFLLFLLAIGLCALSRKSPHER